MAKTKPDPKDKNSKTTPVVWEQRYNTASGGNTFFAMF